MRTEIGDVRVDIPRDRNGMFQPLTVPVGQRRLAGLDAQVISLYAKGLTTGDIASQAQEFGTGVAPAGGRLVYWSGRNGRLRIRSRSLSITTRAPAMRSLAIASRFRRISVAISLARRPS